MYDLAIVGGGPVGLAAAIAAKRAGLSYTVLEKGCVVNAIFDYPTYMTFFTTAPELEIGGHPMVSPREKPDRKEALMYYRLVAEREALDLQQYTEVTNVHAAPAGFTLEVNHKDGTPGVIEARRVVVATGYYDNPVMMGIPGEERENVSHYYTEAHPFWNLKVTVIGAGNSAADAALDLWRGGAQVTMIVRAPSVKNTVKYWVKPDLENRIKEGSIAAHFESRAVEIGDDYVVVENQSGEKWQLPTDFTFALTGYRPKLDFLAGLGLAQHEDECLMLSDTFESSVPGLFVVGSAGFAGRTNQVFIENGREHALVALAEIARQLQAVRL
ncbi:YpdA family putative bacillithiol disulfide reductase [Deinococcus peraridilitoris]|nr:YpdA family putative bacillithiol disulfide reductase [Deinococcus peraridilitoris]